MFHSVLATTVGPLQLTVDERGVLLEILLPNRRHVAASKNVPAPAQSGIDVVSTQLDEYFAKKRREFDVRLDPRGSPFEVRVWERLLEIPYGSTTTYGAIAAEFEMENGARAVGRANGRNPIPIIIPCHRVIGADGALVGFGGGLPLKETLLQLEGASTSRGMRLPLELI